MSIAARRRAVVELYRDIADWVMPHVAQRPLTVVRCTGAIVSTDALRTQCAFVRHSPRDNVWASRSTPRVRIQEQRKLGEYLYVESIEQLISLIERGVAEWHVWGARTTDVERPDRIVFDLDPGEGTPWMRVTAAARQLRDALKGIGLQSWPKTTGGRGLHVVMPIEPIHTWDEVFAFSRTVAAAIARHDPQSYTASFDRSERRGKVLIDYKRNHRTSIAVAAYSTRVHPAVTISTPVRWSEVNARLRPDRFTLADLRARLRAFERSGSDPWEGLLECRQRLPVPAPD